MWIPISLGMRLTQSLAVLLDRILVDIAFYRFRHDDGEAGSLDNGFRELTFAFECLEKPASEAIQHHYFRPNPICFTPILYSPPALYEAAGRSARFAYQIGRLLEERLGLMNRVSLPTVVEDGAGIEFESRLDELTAQTGELLYSGDLPMVVLVHRMLVRAQSLCALLAMFTPLRALAGLSLAAPILMEPSLR